MGMQKILFLPLNDTNALRVVRETARQSCNVFLVEHAKVRMRQRRITLIQVLTCLRKGNIYESAYIDIKGDCRLTLRHVCAGDDIRVAVAVKRDTNNKTVAVITVF